MIRYCLIDQEVAGDNTPAVHFFQWANAFKVKVTWAGDAIDSLYDGQYDIIHVRLCRENLALIKRIRHIIGQNSHTKLVLTLDINKSRWLNEFNGAMEEIAQLADILTASTYALAKELELVSKKRTYELPHPADVGRLKYGIKRSEKKEASHKKAISTWRIFHHLRAVLATLNFLRKQRKYTSDSRDVLVEKDTLQESNWVNHLDANGFVAATHDDEGQGEFYIYAAARKRLVIGYETIDSVRRCYPFTALKQDDSTSVRNYHYWLQTEEALRNFYIENAFNKVEYYNWGNSLHRYYCMLNHALQQQIFAPSLLHSNDLIVFYDRLVSLSGPRYVRCNSDEFVLVCLLKNGSEYIKSFMRHYDALNCKHYYFIDNCSTDDTLEKLKEYDNVTIYQTKLAHKDYENEIRKTIIDEQAGCWCLCVDIDELFDYPFSERISMAELLRYLHKNNYTAVSAYMLDMFSKEISFSDNRENDDDLSAIYNYYDISAVQKRPYFSENTSAYFYNKLANDEILKYYGGIRRNKFATKDSDYLLLKHPLIYVDGTLEAITTPHYCNKANVADFTALIRHYKFTPRFKEKVTQSVREGIYTYYAQKEYAAYHNVLKNSEILSLYSPDTSKLFLTADELVKEGFLVVSDSYVTYSKMINEASEVSSEHIN